jgi:rSAM/selenodomain-associated transferase 2
VLPTLGDGPAVARLLAGELAPDPRVEVLVVDAAGDPDLGAIAEARPDVRLVRTQPGRAAQMNAGAERAAGEWLLFLHADSHLPAGWVEAITASPPDRSGGWFGFALDAPDWQARVIERVVAWRVRLLALPYGDQGIFVRRALFHALGGYAALPLMEDVEFVGRLRKAGILTALELPLTTSARRWQQDGWFRRSTWNVLLLTLYSLGVPPHRLARWYGQRVVR